MDQLLAQVEQYKKEIREAVVSSKEELEAFRIKYLGTKGLVKTIMGEMKTVAAEQKKAAGQLLNEFKVLQNLCTNNYCRLPITAKCRCKVHWIQHCPDNPYR